MLVGGLYTLIVVALSGFVGYLIGSKELKRVIEEKLLKPKKYEQSGIVKMRTPEQLKEKDGVGAKIRSLLKDE